MKSFEDNPFHYANFSTDSWERIIHALRFYIEHQEVRLAKDNFGDREWKELACFESILHDIEFYVIGRQP